MSADVVALPAQEPTTRLVAMPTDTNAGGDIFGGWIVAQIDIAGSIVAARKAAGRVVTVAVNAVQFHHPVFVGDLISCYANIRSIGRTSITVAVDVYAERGAEIGHHIIHVTEAVLTYVAVDDQRRPRPVVTP